MTVVLQMVLVMVLAIDKAGRRDIDEASACRTLKWGARGAEANAGVP